MRALTVALCLFAFTPAWADGPPEPELPGWLRGFAGELEGTVVESWEHAFLLDVKLVPNVWKHSESRKPKKAVGRTLLINLQWEKHGEEWRPRPRQVQWLTRFVHEGDTVRVDVANDEGQRLHVMELNQAQRRLLNDGEHGDHDGERGDHDGEQARRGPPIPEAFRGFSGQVAGTVVRVHGDDAFLLLVQDVIRTWEGNEAREPATIEWRAVRVFPRHGEEGLSRRHQHFISRLEPGQELRIELRHREGRVEILELSEAQRRLADQD